MLMGMARVLMARVVDDVEGIFSTDNRAVVVCVHDDDDDAVVADVALDEAVDVTAVVEVADVVCGEDVALLLQLLVLLLLKSCC
jgi:hypothetical protein